ncbi:hypothetical protein G6F22_017936 [Rhizopus arrhizus]|nr:hypothetical protein G6F22_017936 [Rhizopus arrhizus]
MLPVADAAGGDDGYRHGIRHGAGQLQVEARLGAVAVHAGQEDLARAIGSHAARPGHGVQPGGLAAAVREDFPARGLAGRRHAARVDGHDHALRAMVVGGSADQFRIGHGRAIDADLVGPGIQQALDVGHLAHAAAHRQRDEDLRGHLAGARADDLANPVRAQQGGKARGAVAGVVVDDDQVFRALFEQGVDQFHGLAGSAEAADHDGRAIMM